MKNSERCERLRWPPRLPTARFPLSRKWPAALLFVTLATCLVKSQQPVGLVPGPNRKPVDDPERVLCEVAELKKSETQGLRVYSPDGKQVLINKEDEEGTAQVYLGQADSSDVRCITCDEQPNGPKRNRRKMQPHWHPSGKWVFLAVERDEYTTPPVLGLSRDYVIGELQCGLWTDMWAVSPDRQEWHRLTNFKSDTPGTPDGFTGVAFTPDGKKAFWSQIVDGNIFVYYPFGRWEMILADFEEKDGVPTLTNLKNITPAGMNWNEPGNFHPDNETLVFSGSDQKDAQGMDIYTLNVRTLELTNLTKSPSVWDEHGVFSPDGKKITFMSAYPYRDDPSASQILWIRTESMIMNSDASDIQQLTHFRKPGYPEYSQGIAANAEWSRDGRTLNLTQLYFPKLEYWDITFRGGCGDRTRRRR